MKKRVFIAINLPDFFKQQIGNFIKKLQPKEPGIKWVDPQNIHFTLAFLGEIEKEEIAKVTAILKLLAKNEDKFEIGFGKLRIFPSINSPRILWIGTNENLNLINLQNKLQKQLKINRFKVEKRTFIPHMTIGRVRKGIKDIKGILQLSKKLNLGSFLVSSIDVMESILKSNGPEYKIIFKVNLKS